MTSGSSQTSASSSPSSSPTTRHLSYRSAASSLDKSTSSSSSSASFSLSSFLRRGSAGAASPSSSVMGQEPIYRLPIGHSELARAKRTFVVAETTAKMYLPLKKGQIVRVYEGEREPGWCEGEDEDGRRGLFPSYVDCMTVLQAALTIVDYRDYIVPLKPITVSRTPVTPKRSKVSRRVRPHQALEYRWRLILGHSPLQQSLATPTSTAAAYDGIAAVNPPCSTYRTPPASNVNSTPRRTSLIATQSNTKRLTSIPSSDFGPSISDISFSSRITSTTSSSYHAEKMGATDSPVIKRALDQMVVPKSTGDVPRRRGSSASKARSGHSQQSSIASSSLCSSTTSNILEPAGAALSLMRKAVESQRAMHFQPSTACFVSAVRSVLEIADLPSPPSRRGSNSQAATEAQAALQQARTRIDSEVLELQCIAKTAASPKRTDGREQAAKMQRSAEMILLDVEQFVEHAASCGIEIPSRRQSISEGWSDEEDETRRFARQNETPIFEYNIGAPSSTEASPTAFRKLHAAYSLRTMSLADLSIYAQGSHDVNALGETLCDGRLLDEPVPMSLLSSPSYVNGFLAPGSTSFSSLASSASRASSIMTVPTPPALVIEDENGCIDVIECTHATQETLLSLTAALIAAVVGFIGSDTPSRAALIEVTDNILFHLRRVLIIVISVYECEAVRLARPYEISALSHVGTHLLEVRSEFAAMVEMVSALPSPKKGKREAFENSKTGLREMGTRALQASYRAGRALCGCVLQPRGVEPFEVKMKELSDGELFVGRSDRFDEDEEDEEASPDPLTQRQSSPQLTSFPSFPSLPASTPPRALSSAPTPTKPSRDSIESSASFVRSARTPSLTLSLPPLDEASTPTFKSSFGLGLGHPLQASVDASSARSGSFSSSEGPETPRNLDTDFFSGSTGRAVIHMSCEFRGSS